MKSLKKEGGQWNNEQTLANVSSAQAVKIPDEEEIDRCWEAGD